MCIETEAPTCGVSIDFNVGCSAGKASRICCAIPLLIWKSFETQ